MSNKSKDPRPADIKSMRADAYRQIEENEEQKKLAKMDMKTIWVSSQDKNDIGMFSSGWDKFITELRGQFKKSRDAGNTQAHDIAKYLNQAGIKTASGCNWTPRLVNIAKEMLGIKHGSKIINLK